MFITIKIRKGLLVFLISIVLLIIVSIYYRESIRKYLKISYRSFYSVSISNEKLIYIENDLNINKLDYKWTEGLNFINKPKKIVFHHAARSLWDPEGINEFHKSKGWKGIGYNYYIRKDGSIYKGRDENAEGAHTKGENNNSIGICLEGNFEEENISDEQLESSEKLSYYLILKYDIYEIIGHRDVSKTLCPGRKFPLDKIREEILLDIKNKK